MKKASRTIARAALTVTLLGSLVFVLAAPSFPLIVLLLCLCALCVKGLEALGTFETV